MSVTDGPQKSRFSDRVGGDAPRRPLQVIDLDRVTRNRLWNTVEAECGTSVSVKASPAVRQLLSNPDLAFTTRIFARLDPPIVEPLPFVRLYWVDHLGYRGSEVVDVPAAELMQEVERVFTDGTMAEVFDALEILIEAVQLRENEAYRLLVHRVNITLERTGVAYRITDGSVLPITDDTERATIEEALNVSSKAAGPHQQLQVALRQLRANEWAAAVAASFLAVEGAARWAVGDDAKATLPEALRTLRGRGTVPPALVKAWGGYYGFASDTDNIRHGGPAESGATRELASYFVVTSSALVTFLLTAKLDA
jgi:hypothetical protein